MSKLTAIKIPKAEMANIPEPLTIGAHEEPFSEYQHYMQKFLNSYNNSPLMYWFRGGIQNLLGASVSAPKVDIMDCGNYFAVRADLPGVKAKDIEISINNRHLIIKGIREEICPAGHICISRESNHGTFRRDVVMPENIDISKAKAHICNGVLTIDLHKKFGRKKVSDLALANLLG